MGPSFYCLIHFYKRSDMVKNKNVGKPTKLLLLDSLLQEKRNG